MDMADRRLREWAKVGLNRIRPNKEAKKGVTFIGNTVGKKGKRAEGEIDHVFKKGTVGELIMETRRMRGLSSGHAQIIIEMGGGKKKEKARGMVAKKWERREKIRS